MESKNKKNAIYIIILLPCIFLLFGFFWAFNNRSKVVPAKYNEICVSYSTDSNYIFPTLVSMTSLMKKANNNTFCKFYILHNELSNEDKAKLNSISKKYKNCSVDLVDVKDSFSNSYEGRWSVATYFRLLLPDILKNKSKCLYLDGDTIVRHDLYDMFNTDLSDFYIAGVHDGYLDEKKSPNYYREILGLEDVNSYVCAGVLLMNLEKMRNDNICNISKDLVLQNDKDKKFSCLDQDILNKVCYGHIKLLPFKFGMHTHVLGSYSEKIYTKNLGISQNEFSKMKNDPTIVHFSAGKPWHKIHNNVENFCKEWWDYARETDYINEIEEKYPLGQSLRY